MVEAVKDNRMVSVAGCNGSGKDWTAGRVVLWWMLNHYPAKVIISGPTHRQVADIVWNETRIAYNNSKYPLGGRMYQTTRWQLDDQHFALGVVTNDPYNLQGFHSPNLLVVITEAHAVKQPEIEALRRLNAKTVLMTGNPFTTQGEFYDSHHSMRHLYKTIQISAFDTPNIIEGKQVVEGMVSMEDIEDRKAQWGETSAMYRASVLGQFPNNLEDVIIPLDLALESVKRKNQPEGEVVVACDIARYGKDKTVAVKRQGDTSEIIYSVQGKDLMTVAGWLGRYCLDNSVDRLVVDDTGLGGGVTDRLQEVGMGSTDLVPFKAGTKASQDDRFGNAITESWWRMREWVFDNGQLPDNKDLLSQVSSRRYNIQSDRRLMLEPKEKMHKSPDEGDAMAMTFIDSPGYGVW